MRGWRRWHEWRRTTPAQTGAGHEAMVLFSDGQHNEGESPLEVAKLLAADAEGDANVGLAGH